MKVLNKEISEKLLSKIISDIKDKPQFKNIEESFVKDLLKKELEKDSKLIDQNNYQFLFSEYSIVGKELYNLIESLKPATKN